MQPERVNYLSFSGGSVTIHSTEPIIFILCCIEGEEIFIRLLEEQVTWVWIGVGEIDDRAGERQTAGVYGASFTVWFLARFVISVITNLLCQKYCFNVLLLIYRCSIDLSRLEREKTHRIWQDLEEGAGSIFLLLTISGTTASETISDLTTYEENARERENLENRYVSISHNGILIFCKFYIGWLNTILKDILISLFKKKNLDQDLNLGLLLSMQADLSSGTV